VSRKGTSFLLNGQPFRFVGSNLYNAAVDLSTYDCGFYVGKPEADVAGWFDRVKADQAAKVIRFWAFQKYTNGGTNWTGLDRVMRLANQRGLKLLPVLENQWSDCTEGGDKLDTWYADGYQRPYGAYPLSYKEYVRRVVSRYKDDPAVFAWSLMNEAESQTAASVPAPAPLHAFARDMSSYVKSLDPNHLVTLGIQGTKQAGADNANYEALEGLPTIDFCTYHDYRANDTPYPGEQVAAWSPVFDEIFTQDAYGTYRGQGHTRRLARQWETLSWKVPAGATPFSWVGLNVNDSFVGNVYIDDVRVGSTTFTFEEGMVQEWTATNRASVSTSSGIASAGTRALKIALAPGSGNSLIRVPVPAGVAPGDDVVVHMYVDTPGWVEPQNTLAAAVYKAKQLDKPIVIDEAGMRITSHQDWQVETIASRATKFDAKMQAFLIDQGGNGYLVWDWKPFNTIGGFEFVPDDPLNETLKKHALAIGAS
jgi:hypothetical protein